MREGEEQGTVEERTEREDCGGRLEGRGKGRKEEGW